ncbi:MAG: hypothetical protein H8E30_10645 [Alphaproteobacteria bacterium]|nr:hypothetical protein [Alphaproteobacteria bacterium]
MTNLITCLEQAETGSRELSDEVLLALGWGRQYEVPLMVSDRPNLTVSVDDTKLLMPDGWVIRHIADEGTQWVCYLGPKDYDEPAQPPSFAKTEANARCIAIMKAHEHGGERR